MLEIRTFTTDRLIATCLQSTDFDILCRLHRDPKVMATLGGVRSDAETERFLQGKIAHWTRHGFGYWIFREQTTGRFVGRGGLQRIELVGNPEVEVGYTVQAADWGQGMATEMAKSLVALGFSQFGLPNLVCFTLTTNHASARVMAKVGFQFEQTITHGGARHLLYRLQREQFLTDAQVSREIDDREQ